MFRFKKILSKIIVSVMITGVILTMGVSFSNAKGINDSYYGPLTYYYKTAPAGVAKWDKKSQTSVSYSKTYDAREEMHVVLTANFFGEVSFDKIKFNVGFSGTVECTFVRDRYDYWRSYTQNYVGLTKHYVFDWYNGLRWDGTYVETGDTATQPCKVWQEHKTNDWVLAEAYKR